MSRSPASPPARRLRRATGVALFAALAGCGGKDAAPRPISDAGVSDAGSSDARTALVVSNRFRLLANRDLDLLFTIDDSPSMAPLQAKMAAAFSDFISVLGETDGLPNLNVAIVSSSLGAGVFGNVTGCQPGTIGNLNGSFQHRAACTQLHANQKFISSSIDATGARVNNFDGDIATALGCMVQLGQSGCEFEHQFEATRLSLQRASNPQDPDNAGFLRPSAYLAVVMLTNEDDCSVDASSMLFDPNQRTLADPLGGLQSYRCNEFGHKCNGVSPPHVPPASIQALNNCVSAETDGRLITTDGYIRFLQSLKPNPNQLVVAAIAGPAAPYAIESRSVTLATGAVETQPAVAHSCTQGATEYGDPGVRIKNWVDAFGATGIFQSICADDFRPAMTAVATLINKTLGARCVDGAILTRPDGTPDCAVVERAAGAMGRFTDTSIPVCDGSKTVVPCWAFTPSAKYCPKGQLFQICHDATCGPSKLPTVQTDALVWCAIAAPAN